MKSFKNILLPAVAALFVGMMLASCGTQKKAAVAPVVPEQSTGNPVSDFKMMAASYSPGWKKVRIPVSASVVEPVSLGASGYLTMERGRSVNLSMRVLGMEVASLYLTQDSVVVIDRWNKRYISQGLTKFLNGFPVTIDNLQDLLLGRLFLVGEGSIDAKDADKFIFDADGSVWGCKPRSENDLFGYAFVASGTNLMYLHIFAGKGDGEAAYGEPEPTPCGVIASGVTVKTKAGKKNINATLTYKPNKAQWDDDVRIPQMEVPRSYKRVDASSVIKGFKAP